MYILRCFLTYIVSSNIQLVNFDTKIEEEVENYQDQFMLQNNDTIFKDFNLKKDYKIEFND